MQINEFKAVVATFSDPGSEILYDKERMVISVNNDLIEAAIRTKSGDVYVDEGNGEMPGSEWIVIRLARLPLLAARLRESVSTTKYFIPPSAYMLPTLAASPAEEKEPTSNALHSAMGALEDRSSLETTVLYFTSDAGEGKTSLINELARSQAQRFTEKKSDWLLVPIPLGGRHFLRFDDITVGALQNRYRFPFLYYNSFIALVKMGVIIPAFDGFEEMFVESSSGEALSAMGILVGSLDSTGAIVVAARKAYFEFENLKTQERLFDTIRSYSVGFGKLELMRWERQHFLKYCERRGVTGADHMYQKVSERLGADHSLLTRPVLVRRLVDVAQESESLDSFLEKIHGSGADYFAVFVRSIIEREANEKWIDRSGESEAGTALLSVNEHCELLSELALSMWESRVDFIKRDGLELVADYFCDMRRKNAFQTQQVRERLRGHAMLVPSPNAAQAVEFDHDEFRLYFLGEGIVSQIRPLTDRSRGATLGTLRRAILPPQAQEACIRALKRDGSLNIIDVIRSLLSVAGMDAQASYTHENCSDLIIRLVDGQHGSGLEVKDLAFGQDALRDRKLWGVKFTDCYFSPTSLEITDVHECTFVNCRFAQLRLFKTTVFNNVEFSSCTVDSVVLTDTQRETWEPGEVKRHLAAVGVRFAEEDIQHDNLFDNDPFEDAPLRDFERLVRYFMRSTHISDSVILMKLGERGTPFLVETVPRLEKHGVLEEIENRGGGSQRRYRIAVPVQRLTDAIEASSGSFNRFLEQFAPPDEAGA